MARAEVVPTTVKLRLVAIVSAMLGLIGLCVGCGRYEVALLLLAGGLSVLWSLWTGFTLGISPALRGELPTPPGQPLRLSFDDGPTAELTPQLLDLLQRHRVTASFFVLLPKARAQPELVRRILSDGHLLGLHGEDHRWPFFRSAADLTASLRRARRELERLAGQPVTLYRPSHGFKTPALLRAVRRAGLRLSFWDYGVWDTDAPPLPLLLKRLNAIRDSVQPANRPPIVLLHDGRGDEPGPPPHGRVLLAALASWLPRLTGRS